LLRWSEKHFKETKIETTDLWIYVEGKLQSQSIAFILVYDQSDEKKIIRIYSEEVNSSSSHLLMLFSDFIKS